MHGLGYIHGDQRFHLGNVMVNGQVCNSLSLSLIDQL